MENDWIQRALGDFAQRVKCINSIGEELPPLSVTKDHGILLQSQKFKKRIATDLRKYLIARRGEFVFDPMSLYYGSIGRVHVAERGVVSPDYVVFACDDSVEPGFLEYLLRSSMLRGQFELLAEGGNQFGKRRRVYWSVFRDIKVMLPPLGEQRKIAAILASVDETIEKTEAVIAQLQVVKKAMMQELLTRGLPGRHTRFKHTELGEVPVEWQVGPLGDFCKTASGGTPDRNQASYWNGGIPWVKTGEINYSIIADTEERITEAGLANSAARLFPAGTVLMAMYGQGATRGRVAILGIEATTNQACLAFFPDSHVDNLFLYHMLSWSYERLRSMGHEGSQKNLNAALVKSLLITVPGKDEQQRIVETLDGLDDDLQQECGVVEKLRQLKSALMSALLTGQVRVTPDEDTP